MSGYSHHTVKISRENQEPKPTPPSEQPPARAVSTQSVSLEAETKVELQTLPDIFGRYRIVALLGEGGMGSVYSAHDQQLDRLVALKLPRLNAGDDEEVLERFYRETRAMASVEHPNLCTIHDVGEHEGIPYFTMSFIQGRSLDDHLKQEGPFSVAQASKIVRKLASAMEAAHKAGVVHRDLKLSNVIIRTHGEPIILDFGLAQQEVAGDNRLTQTGIAMGTPSYMSPEQVDGDLDRIGPPTDVYSLGVMLFELLTGRLPFTGSMASVMGQILRDEVPAPTTVRDGLPPQLNTICRKAMAKKPEARYTAGELAKALEQSFSESRVDPVNTIVLEPRSEESRHTGQKQDSTLDATGMSSMVVKSQEDSSTRTAPTRAAPPRKSRTRIWLAMAGGLIVLLGIVIIIKNQDGTRTEIRLPEGADVEVIREPAPKPNPQPPAQVVPKGTTPAVAERAPTKRPPLPPVMTVKPTHVVESLKTYPVDPTPLFVVFRPQSKSVVLRLEGVGLSQLELATGDLITPPPQLEDSGGRIWKIVPSLDGKHLFLFAKFRGIRWIRGSWNRTTVVRKEKKIEGNYPLAVSPDSQRIAAVEDDHLAILDIKTAKPVVELVGETEGCLPGEFSADSQWLIAQQPGESLVLWNLSTGKVEGTFPIPKSTAKEPLQLYSPSFLGLNHVACGTSDGRVLVFNRATGFLEHTWKLPHGNAKFFQVVSDTQVAVTGNNSHHIFVWDALIGGPVYQLLGHQKPITGQAFSGIDHQLATCSQDNTLRLWNTKDLKKTAQPLPR